MFENVERGMYLIGDTEMYFRSGWEAKYALYLEWLKRNGEIKDWKFEPRFFDFPIAHGTTRYLPDFWILENNGTEHYDEVKGYFDAKSKTKLKRMAKYYPDVKVNLIQADWFKAMRQKGMGKLLKW